MLADDGQPCKSQQTVPSRLPRGGLAGSMKASSLAALPISEGASQAQDRDAGKEDMPGLDTTSEPGPSSSDILSDGQTGLAGRSVNPRLVMHSYSLCSKWFETSLESRHMLVKWILMMPDT